MKSLLEVSSEENVYIMDLRENNIDLLKVISCIMVITIHVAAIYGKKINLEYPGYYFTIGNFYHSITRTAVPIFVMLSGNFLIENKRNINYRYHYRKTFNRIIIPTLIFSVLYLIFSIFIGIISEGNNFDYLEPFNNFILGNPYYHMWYMYMIIGCYAITPILIKLRLKIGNERFELIGWGGIILGVLINLKDINLIWPISFIEYLGYFILGYSLKDKNKSKKRHYLIYLIISCIILLLIFIITEFCIRYNILKNNLYFLTPLSPMVIISSIFMYIAFLNMKNIKINYKNISINTFNIYLVHAGVLSLINGLFNKLLKKYLNPIWYIPFLIIIVFSISYIISIIMNKMITKVKINK